jgi:hypothetical protein
VPKAAAERRKAQLPQWSPGARPSMASGAGGERLVWMTRPDTERPATEKMGRGVVVVAGEEEQSGGHASLQSKPDPFLSLCLDIGPATVHTGRHRIAIPTDSAEFTTFS